MLCPNFFDFPNSGKPGRYYIGTSIDLNRKEESFHWELLDDKRPLLFCSLGTITWFPRHSYQRFYQAVIDASRTMPEWQWVVKIGDSLSVADFHSIPSNVIVVNRAPQTAILKRAAIMITHGGLTTIRECICSAVPMVVYPLGNDHPGYAARVVFHGLGLRGDFLHVTEEKVRSLVEAIDKDPYYRMQSKIMQMKCKELEEQCLGIKLIEAMLAEQDEQLDAVGFGGN